MAVMIPPVVDPNCKSPGEKEIFRRLMNDPATKDWIILHSLSLAKHRSQVSGEIDFVVIIPNKGVLCIEVKAHHRVKRDASGRWFYGESNTPDIRGPFKQASEAMHSLREQVINQRPDLSRILFWSVVIFPYTEFRINSPEWHSWQVIDCGKFRSRSLGQLLLDTINKARKFFYECRNTGWFSLKSNEPYIDQCKEIAHILRPSFEYFVNRRVELKLKEEEIYSYTKEQLISLDAMEANPRVIFCGPAGTGKTVLAIEAARRSAAKNIRVLLLCYNRLLGRYISEKVKEFGGLVECYTIHKYLTMLCGKQNFERIDDPVFWENELPALALKEILESKRFIELYDEVIIDEAQDILRNNYLDIIDLSLKGGLAAGKWRFFGDFEKQAIYKAADVSINQLLRERVGETPIFQLRVNCRNTPRVAAMAEVLGGLCPEYKKVLRPDDGIDVETEFYQTYEEQRDALISILDMLYEQGFKGNDIVILSPKADGCASKLQLDFWKCRMKEYDHGLKGYVGISTIQAFKGLEAPIVIITDIDYLNTDETQSLLYIAITRSLLRAYILVNKSAESDYYSIMIKNALMIGGRLRYE